MSANPQLICSDATMYVPNINMHISYHAFHYMCTVFQIYNAYHELCASFNDENVIVATCNHGDEKQMWTWTTYNQIKNQGSGKCLDVTGEVAKLTKLHMSTCDSRVSTQQWSCSDYFVQLNGTDFYMEYGVLSGAEIYLTTSISAYGQWQIFDFKNYNICFAKP